METRVDDAGLRTMGVCPPCHDSPDPTETRDHVQRIAWTAYYHVDYTRNAVVRSTESRRRVLITSPA